MAYSLGHHEDEQEEEESYFVSMTDIMVGLLFIFIILLMYLVLQIRHAPSPDLVPRSDYQIALNKIKDLERQIELLQRDRLETYLKAADLQRTEILNRVADIMNLSGVKVEVVPEQGILRLKADILFASGHSTLEASALDKVNVLARALRQVLPCFTVGPLSDPVRRRKCNSSAAFVDAIFVEGHTDSDAVTREIDPGITDNLRLSSRRATNTLQQMREIQPELELFFSVTPTIGGTPIGQGTTTIFNASAFGDTRPVAPNDTLDGKSRNRRIDIRLLMYSPRSDTIDTIERLVQTQPIQ